MGEAKAERVRLDLERLFGPEVKSWDSDLPDEADDFPPVTSIPAEELYGHLEREGLLRRPLTIARLVHIDGDAEYSFDPRFWGDWRSRQFQLVRDQESNTRIRYSTVVRPLLESGEEIFVSQIWSGDQVSEHTGFGALLEGRDGVYRAGLEVGRKGFLRRVAPTSNLDQVLQEVDTKFKTYAQAARETQVTLAREQEVEKEARAARSLNLRFVGVEEKNDEDTMETVTTLCKDVLKVATPRFVRVVRVGRSEKGPRTILVRFNAVEDRSIVLCNRHMLKGMRVWIDADLMPAQADDRRKELAKVKTAQEAEFVAYLRNDRAVITDRKREEK
ncbi:hypothetical protein R1sor_027197 [Riccia sorocarpa]|uniref:Uncharacterized protein n=1 Tax=Riccia sorocarpa TaxID=122646 RepID=A0ABD3GFN3_9MARC